MKVLWKEWGLKLSNRNFPQEALKSMMNDVNCSCSIYFKRKYSVSILCCVNRLITQYPYSDKEVTVVNTWG